MHPRAMKRTFTFREMATILAAVEDPLPDTDDPQRLLLGLAELGTANRGLHRPARQEDLDIADPYRRGDEVYALMREQVLAAYPAIERALG